MSLRNHAYVFHQKNPLVYELICRFADDAIRKGHARYAIATIWERIRWEITVNTNDVDFKMPNNHRAYYSRMWLANHPKHSGFFRIARLRSEQPGPVDRFGRSIDPHP